MILPFEIYNICENLMVDFDKVVQLIEISNTNPKFRATALDKAKFLIIKNDFDKSDFEHRISKRDLDLIYTQIDTLDYDN